MNLGHVLKNKNATVLSIEPDDLLTEAVARMMANRVGSLVVLDNGKLLSIVTERDVMWAVNSHDANVKSVRVRDVMAKQLVTCETSDTLDQAMNMMINNALGHRIRHLPVMENGEFIGLISIGDIVQALLTETKFENNLLKHYIKNWPESEEA